MKFKKLDEYGIVFDSEIREGKIMSFIKGIVLGAGVISILWIIIG